MLNRVTAMAGAKLPAFLTVAKGKTQIALHVKPNARSEGVAWTAADGCDAIEVRSMAPPREGAANEDVIKQMSKALGVPKTSIVLVAGMKSKDKVIALAESADAILDKLRALRE